MQPEESAGGAPPIDLKTALFKFAALGPASGGLAWIVGRVVPGNIVPDNLLVLRDASTPIVFVTVVATWLFHRYVKFRAAEIAVVTCLVALFALLALQQAFVVPVDIGSPATEKKFLVGFATTPKGEVDAQRCGTSVPSELIECAGLPEMGDIWGRSYQFIALAYIALYLLFLLTATVAVSVSVIQPITRSANAREPRF